MAQKIRAYTACVLLGFIAAIFWAVIFWAWGVIPAAIDADPSDGPIRHAGTATI
jgi:hypothetical protein